MRQKKSNYSATSVGFLVRALIPNSHLLTAAGVHVRFRNSRADAGVVLDSALAGKAPASWSARDHVVVLEIRTRAGAWVAIEGTRLRSTGHGFAPVRVRATVDEILDVFEGRAPRARLRKRLLGALGWAASALVGVLWG